jgi:predicted metalloprotease with PDZ domain
MKKSFLVLLLSPLFLLAQKSYQYSLSLNNVTNDQIHVTLVPPAIEGKEIKFSFPKIVPGTYSISDYGRFIENFNAYDNKGIKIETQTSGLNAWIIDNTKGISKVEYDMNDTYDSKLDNPIFEPAGSDIEKDSIYMLNLHCLLGYFQNQMEVRLLSLQFNTHRCFMEALPLSTKIQVHNFGCIRD